MKMQSCATGARSGRLALAAVILSALVVASGSARSSGADPPRQADPYLTAVRDQLHRFLVYPEDAIAKKQQGRVFVGFKFRRDGTLIDVWIDNSSGYPSLDQAALKMVRAASPFPVVPDQYQGDTFNVVIPESFKIGVFRVMLP